MASWTLADAPDQTGRVAIVTGANAGLGFQLARALASRGAHTVLACRDAGRAAAAEARIRTELPDARLELAPLDLADLASVHRFANHHLARHGRVDLLVNNAGVVLVRKRATTVDGFELQLGTNHLGHFALTGLLLPGLLVTPGARVTTMTSMEIRWARLDLDDLHSERRYGADRAYAQSKFANLLFAVELDRRLRARGSGVLSTAAHPGWSATDQRQGALIDTATRLFAQPAERGALPALYAATAPGVEGGAFVGPGALFGMRGAPKVIGVPGKARDEEVAGRLWAASEEQTGVTYSALVS
jgi:NAD(P)-dependent dehydrogenase (short-subunit alcohol dehydrogenase family)